MANTIALKRRIGSVKNTKQITKAMELVAASKMRKAQEAAQKSREYRSMAYSLLARLSAVTDVDQHPLFRRRDVKKRLHIAITSNRGLAGAYNANIIRLLAKAVTRDQKEGIQSQVIAVGKKAANFTRRLEGVELLAVYDSFSDEPTANDIRPILRTVIDMYSSEQIDSVSLHYTNFKSNLAQEATELPLLPAVLDDKQERSPLENATLEPSIGVVLDNVAERLLEIQIWQALLESVASEHSMRMMAMKNATDNASDLIDDLTLAFNTARQAAITQELAEITGGAEAVQS